MANVTTAMQGLIAVFMSHANDCTTLSELDERIQRVRKKTLVAHRPAISYWKPNTSSKRCAQRPFTTLVVSQHPSIPTFSIAPNAFALARQLSINDSEIVRAITS